MNQINRERMNPIPVGWQEKYLKSVRPLTDFFSAHKINPNTLTTLGFIFNVVAAIFYSLSYLRLGGLFVILGGVSDTLDGKIARRAGKGTKFGALFDSVMDRYSEIIMFFGIAVHFVRTDSYWTSVAIFAAVGGSVMVSYVRARAEGLGIDCEVGIMQRPERIFYIAAGSLIGKLPLINELFLILAIWIIAVLANYTAVQRLIHVYKVTREQAGESSQTD